MRELTAEEEAEMQEILEVIEASETHRTCE